MRLSVKINKCNMQAILKKADEQIKRAILLLNKGAELLPNSSVPAILLNQGFTQYKGVIVPLESVSHKYLFEYYEKTFLLAYITLLMRLWEEKSALTNEFAFRVLLEMGIENSFLIYDKRVEENDKKIYLLILLLADYSSIETSMKSVFYKWFEKLLCENKAFLQEKLTEKDWKKIIMLEEVVEDPTDKIKYRQTITKVRRLINDVKSRLLQKYSQSGIYIENENIKGMKSGESHTLHGNVFLLINRLNKKSGKNHLFRVCSYILIPCISVLKRLSEYHGNEKYTKEVNQFLSDYNTFGKEISLAWASLK